MQIFQEDFVGMHAIENIKSNIMAVVFKDVFTFFNISLSNCPRQCYDGASNMAGHKKGVVSQILKESLLGF